ncbi:MAG: DNA-formamidopyrimidine glycosylase family protein [Polyangiales bacterium]
MPEGDTIHRTATALAAVLVGRVVARLASNIPVVSHARLVGHTITGVDAHGKNLFIRFDDGRVLHSHMQMTGSWHLYQPGERWKRPAYLARCVIEVEAAVAVCFSAPVLRVLTAPALARDDRLTALGPDILGETFDEGEAMARIHSSPGRQIGDAILEQRFVAGIGNIYKSESLFVARLDPFVTVATLGDEPLKKVLAAARKLMRANLRTVVRTTTSAGAASGRYWVYGRSRRPCRRCGTRIQMRRQGKAARSTYWCPRCQQPQAAGSAT